jgi:glyoxylase-like metal-dependent hydrolase (beta-lactamase superfamily II)
MLNYICVQCGVQFAASEAPPASCPICEDERQYVNWNGQQWTTLAELAAHHRNKIQPEGPHVFGIGTEPSFAIGQRALLAQSPGGNVLWDCISLIDDATIRAVQDLGGISAIAISHPHFYSSVVEWSYALGKVPIYIHSADRRWVMRPDPVIQFWDGETRTIGEGMTLVRCGIHFEGGQVLHWADGAEGRGAILSGDIFQVATDRRFVSFMRSYPNYIPERASIIRQAVQKVEPLEFDVIYGGWWNRNVVGDAHGALRRSAERYLRQTQTE